MKKLIILLILLFTTSALAALPVQPTIPSYPTVAGTGDTYYTDKDDATCDNGVGTEADPTCTIVAGIALMSAGDTLIVKEAATAYSESLTLTSLTGSSTEWYQIKGESGERPTISGSTTFNISSGGACSYVYINNFDIVGTDRSVRIRGPSQHIVLDDLDVSSSGTHAVMIGSGAYADGADDIYVRDVIAHGSSDSCVQLYAKSTNVVLERVTVYGSTGDDGIGSHLALLATEEWQYIGPPDDPNDSLGNVYIVDCLSYSNYESGMDLGAIRGETVVKNSKVYSNGRGGIKVWGYEVWLINNLIYENDTAGVGGGGISIKPIWSNSPYYIVGNTIVNNGGVGDFWEFRVVYMNSSYTLKAPSIYLYNNLLQADGEMIVRLDSDGNCPHETCFTEGDGNLYFKPSDNTYGLMEGAHTFGIDEMSDGTWNTASGIDANAVSSITGADPGFTNLAGDDYTLASGSMCIDAGSSSGYDVGIVPTSTWVSSITTDTQSDRGAGYDIGAFLFDLFISNASPANNDAGVSITVDLTWSNPSGTTSIDLLFDKDTYPPTTKELDDQNVETWDCGTLDESSDYYWRVDVNHAGGTETGTVYKFTTSGVPPPAPSGLVAVDSPSGVGIVDSPGGGAM